MTIGEGQLEALEALVDIYEKWLENLQGSDTSSEEDSQVMQTVLRNRLGFAKAVVVYGVVYLDGQGTIANPPRSIQTMAKSLLTAMQNERG